MSEVLLVGALDPEWMREQEVGVRTTEVRGQSEMFAVCEWMNSSRCFRDDPEGKLGRVFRVTSQGTTYEVAVRQVPASGAENFNHAEQPPEIPSDAEVLNLVGRMFLASLPREGGRR
jgi:hypothetical protein